MEKNIAKPIGHEILAGRRRGARAQWENLKTIPAADKKARLDEIARARAALQAESTRLCAAHKRFLAESHSQINALKAEIKLAGDDETALLNLNLDLSNKTNERLDAIKAFNEALEKIGQDLQKENAGAAELHLLKTDEQKAAAVARLDAQENTAAQLGRQPLTPDEIKQRDKDEKEFQKESERREENAYRDKRAAEYMAIGDQLDAIWKGFEALMDGKPLPLETVEALRDIKMVKEKHPPPATGGPLPPLEPPVLAGEMPSIYALPLPEKTETEESQK
jgi:DNA repair exonuclease SbcCD ATPase subunit